jgi:5-dehydro-4-deoxyglucarate dehydratase
MIFMTTPQELEQTVSSGLLSFPLTDFDKELNFAPKPYAERLEWLMPYGATALFAAGGTGDTAGPVPPPLSDMKPAEVDRLAQLISKLGPQ